MEVVRFTRIDELQEHADAWDRLAADFPFRSWAWLATWWRHYAAIGQLYVLGVFDDGQLVGIAPWYRTTTFQHGRTIRFLGDVEVCSEYGTILCQAGREHVVTDALADWLQRAEGRDHWDVIELSASDPEDRVPAALGQQMAAGGCRLHTQAGQGCWRAALPSNWQDYLRSLSKDRRKKIRRLQRQYIDSGQAVWHTARTPQELAAAQAILIDLHQRRRNALGEPGCFASRRYRAFHEEVLPRLLGESRLGLRWVEFDGRPIAAEYQLLGKDVVYWYQGGIAPEDTDLSPGQISMVFGFRESIEKGYQVIDFLRGDEPYKQQWRAEFHPSVELRIVARRTTSQLRHGIWLTGLDAKQWLKGAMGAMHLR